VAEHSRCTSSVSAALHGFLSRITVTQSRTWTADGYFMPSILLVPFHQCIGSRALNKFNSLFNSGRLPSLDRSQRPKKEAASNYYPVFRVGCAFLRSSGHARRIGSSGRWKEATLQHSIDVRSFTNVGGRGRIAPKIHSSRQNVYRSHKYCIFADRVKTS
jgi:hypothetical protein